MATAQYSDALEAYSRAINLNPNDPQVWCSLGVLYYAQGQYREALGMLSRALKLDETMADAWYNVGALYTLCEQHDDARLAYAKSEEYGLSNRFNEAGMSLNAIALQSLDYAAAGSGSSSGMKRNEGEDGGEEHVGIIGSHQSQLESNNLHIYNSIPRNEDVDGSNIQHQQHHQQLHFTESHLSSSSSEDNDDDDDDDEGEDMVVESSHLRENNDVMKKKQSHNHISAFYQDNTGSSDHLNSNIVLSHNNQNDNENNQNQQHQLGTAEFEYTAEVLGYPEEEVHRDDVGGNPHTDNSDVAIFHQFQTNESNK